MAFIQGEGRGQGTLFPVTLDELIPEDHVGRVMDAFVGRLDVAGLGLERAEAAETGRPGYDPRDLLKLCRYGYLQQIRSSRRLESECQRNVELMWWLGRLCPDHKSIAEFRRVHSDAVTEAGAEMIRFARYPESIRRTFSTTNVVEAINGQLEIMRRNSGGYFQSEDILKLKLGLVISSLEQGTWKSPGRLICSALPQLNAMFQSRFEAAA